MKKFLFTFLCIAVSNSWGAEFILQDSECKVLGPDGNQVKVTVGDKSESTCVTVGNEASCNYKNLVSGKSQGKATKFDVFDFKGIQIWKSNPSGNIAILINEKAKTFAYGMTTIVSEQVMLLNKQCVGRIVRQIGNQ